MNDRERLIELIGSFLGGIELTEITPPYGFENLADYLIANGVTVQKQGRWEKVPTTVVSQYGCSACRYCFIREDYLFSGEYNYCPYCGAKMSLEESN